MNKEISPLLSKKNWIPGWVCDVLEVAAKIGDPFEHSKKTLEQGMITIEDANGRKTKGILFEYSAQQSK